MQSCHSSLKSILEVPPFAEVNRYLVIQLEHFVSDDNQAIKEIKHVSALLTFLC